MSEWNGWDYKLCYEVWSKFRSHLVEVLVHFVIFCHRLCEEVLFKVRPYLVEVLVHFVIFCLTMLVVVLILAISWRIVPFCENTLEADALAVKVLVGASDVLIIGHFALYLWQSTSL